MNSGKDLHSIVRQLNPSQEQVDPIRSRGKDIVVTAGAGTGKTRTLVARYLDLLGEGIPLRSIAAITFTKKAAREMRNRVREEVKKYLLRDDLTEDERITWRKVYEDLDAARISTIHSLAGDILRQHPAEMGLDPEFRMLDESETARLKGLAVEAALTWAGGDDQASGLFPIFGEWKLRRVLGELLNKRLDVSAALDGSNADLWPDWEPQLMARLKGFVEDPVVRTGLDELAVLKYDGTIDRAHEAGDLLVEDLRIVVEEWEDIQESLQEGDWVQISRSVGRLGNHLKQKGKGENWAPANPRSVIKEIQQVFNDQIGCSEIDLGVDKRLAEDIIPSLRTLFNYAEEWYENTRGQVNGLDFDDLEEKVLQLFRNHPDALDSWQREVQSILVDEYQDTNSRQRELVNLINGGRNHLFIVGDGKQSIYRFRGADVVVFREEQKRIGSEGEFYHLDTSYRSHSQLLEQLNLMLAPVLGERDDLVYVEPFSELKPGRTSSPKVELTDYVEFHLAAGNKTAGAGDLAAEAVAKRLLEIISFDSEVGEEQRLDFGDVAVLCRASSSFSAFERAFDKADIPYVTVAGQGFYERPEVRDVVNALRVFSDPQNDLALAGLLRSPVSGFTDEFLFDLHEFQQSEMISSLFGAAKEYARRLMGEIRLKLDSFILRVEELSNLAGRVTAAELISRYLEKTTYAAVMALAGEERAVGNLHKLVADAQASGIVNLNDYLNAIEEMRNVAIREGEAQFVSEGAVQIMTVHQAKGLEFPVVVLGDAAKRERYSRDILLDEYFGLLLPFSTERVEEDSQGTPVIRYGRSLAYEIALENERLMEEAETNRLLYVAATRAQDLLMVSGAIGNPTQGGRLPGLSGWLGMLTSELGLDDFELELNRDGSDSHCMHIELGSLSVSVVIYENSVEFEYVPLAALATKESDEIDLDLSSWIELEKEIEPADQISNARKPIYPANVVGRATRVPARIIGEVVHRALELWKFPGGGEGGFIDWLEVAFKAAGVYESEAIKAGYRRVRQILERFTATELFQRMEQAEMTFHEVPYSRTDDMGNTVTGSIDALFREKDHWVLVEFKTDQIRAGTKIDWSTVDYVQQVTSYLDAAESLIEQRPNPILCFLDYGGRVKVITDLW